MQQKLLTSLFDISGHFPKSILHKGLRIWLTLIIPRIVCSFTTSACNVNLCLIDTIHNREWSTTSVGVSQDTWPPDILLYAKGAHLLLHTLKGDVLNPLHSSPVQLTGCKSGWSQGNTYFSVVTNAVLITALF